MIRNVALRRSFAATLAPILDKKEGLSTRVAEASIVFQLEERLTGSDLTRLKKSPDDVDLAKFESCAIALERIGYCSADLKVTVKDLVAAEAQRLSITEMHGATPPVDEAVAIAREAEGAPEKGTLVAYEILSRSWAKYRHTPQGCLHRREAERLLRVLLNLWGPQLRARIIRNACACITEGGTVPGAPEPDARGNDFVKWHASLENLSNSIVWDKTRLATFSFIKPYLRQWRYVDLEIEAMISGDGDGLGMGPYCGPDNLVSPDFFRGRMHAYLYDPHQFESLQRTPFKFADGRPRFEIPQRFAHIVPRALFPLFSGRQIFFDADLARLDVNLTRVNEGVRIATSTFSATVASHFVTGQVMYDQDGNKEFDGYSHITQGNKFTLLHSQSASNTIALSALAITEDSQVVTILRGSHENVFGHASWRSPITGTMNLADFDDGSDELFANAVKRAAHRIATYDFLGGEGDDVIDVEGIRFIGYANAVANGKRPCVFALVPLKLRADELRKRHLLRREENRKKDIEETEVVTRYHRLVPDRREISCLELLDMHSYGESETLRANIMFYLKYLAACRVHGVNP